MHIAEAQREIRRLIYPAMLLMLALMRRPVRLDPANTLPQLATQVAFTIPLALPVGAALLVFAAIGRAIAAREAARGSDAAA
jgi:hypothetical protein